MRNLVRVVAVALALPIFALAQTSTPTPSAAAEPAAHGITVGPKGVATGSRAIHNSALIVDTHADTPGRFVDEN